MPALNDALSKGKCTIDSVYDALQNEDGQKAKINQKSAKKLISLLKSESDLPNGLIKVSSVLSSVCLNEYLVEQLISISPYLSSICDKMLSTAIASKKGDCTDQRALVTIFDLISQSDKLKSQLCMSIQEYILSAIEQGSLHTKLISKSMELLVCAVTHHQENRTFFIKNTSREKITAVFNLTKTTGNPMVQIFSVEFLWRVALPMRLSIEEKERIFGQHGQKLYSIAADSFREGILNFVESINSDRKDLQQIKQIKIKNLIIGDVPATGVHNIYFGSDSILLWVSKNSKFVGNKPDIELVTLRVTDVSGIGVIENYWCIGITQDFDTMPDFFEQTEKVIYFQPMNENRCIFDMAQQRFGNISIKKIPKIKNFSSDEPPKTPRVKAKPVSDRIPIKKQKKSITPKASNLNIKNEKRKKIETNDEKNKDKKTKNSLKLTPTNPPAYEKEDQIYEVSGNESDSEQHDMIWSDSSPSDSNNTFTRHSPRLEEKEKTKKQNQNQKVMIIDKKGAALKKENTKDHLNNQLKNDKQQITSSTPKNVPPRSSSNTPLRSPTKHTPKSVLKPVPSPAPQSLIETPKTIKKLPKEEVVVKDKIRSVKPKHKVITTTTTTTPHQLQQQNSGTSSSDFLISHSEDEYLAPQIVDVNIKPTNNTNEFADDDIPLVQIESSFGNNSNKALNSYSEDESSQPNIENFEENNFAKEGHQLNIVEETSANPLHPLIDNKIKAPPKRREYTPERWELDTFDELKNFASAIRSRLSERQLKLNRVIEDAVAHSLQEVTNFMAKCDSDLEQLRNDFASSSSQISNDIEQKQKMVVQLGDQQSEHIGQMLHDCENLKKRANDLIKRFAQQKLALLANQEKHITLFREDMRSEVKAAVTTKKRENSKKMVQRLVNLLDEL